MTLEEILQLYYDSEQNIELSCFWDAGWTIKIGDSYNGFKHDDTHLNLEDIKEFLLQWYIKHIRDI